MSNFRCQNQSVAIPYFFVPDTTQCLKCRLDGLASSHCQIPPSHGYYLFQTSTLSPFQGRRRFPWDSGVPLLHFSARYPKKVVYGYIYNFSTCLLSTSKGLGFYTYCMPLPLPRSVEFLPNNRFGPANNHAKHSIVHCAPTPSSW